MCKLGAPMSGISWRHAPLLTAAVGVLSMWAVKSLLLPGLVLFLSACAGAGSGNVDVSPSSCEYPEGVVEPMALGEVINAYAWADARHADGRAQSLNLQDAPCDTDPNLDWEPFPVALLVSLPAW